MQAGIHYTVASGEKLVNETFGPNNIRRRTSGTEELQQVRISNGRGQSFSLDRNGFVRIGGAEGIAHDILGLPAPGAERGVRPCVQDRPRLQRHAHRRGDCRVAENLQPPLLLAQELHRPLSMLLLVSVQRLLELERLRDVALGLVA